MAAAPTGPPDVRALQARSMVERLAQQGGPDQGGASPDAAGGQMSQQLSELKGADPQLMMKAAQQIKAMLLAIQVRTSFQTPEAARHAATAQKAMDSMIQVLQKATATVNTVNPIVNQAGVSSPSLGPVGGGQQLLPPGGMGGSAGM